MQKDPKVFIDHILSSIKDIQTYTEGMNKEMFMLNKLVQDAVIRNIEIVGEAAKNLPQAFRNEHQHIPWRSIAGMRDVLIHDYMNADLEAVWTTVTQHLPALKNNLEAL